MKIKEITIHDHELEWHLEPIQFSNLTLLVGVSGVGKTRILQSIMILQSIANGHSFYGLEWQTFFSVNNEEYQWEGQFATQKVDVLNITDKNLEKQKVRIIREKILKNGEIIVQRNNSIIFFKEQKMPRLSPFQSIVNILNEEDIAPIQYGFNQIFYSDHSLTLEETGHIFISEYHKISIFLSKIDRDFPLEDLQKANLPTQIKLALVYNYIPDIFEKIKESFKDIFIQVENLKIEPEEGDNLPEFMEDYPIIQIKERGVNNWISQNQISSGMFRTLMHISELYLSAEGTVILIDEFENSLGVNCIDVVTELLLENKNRQFILTSHHPYIINKIGMEHWKIVTRRGGVVTAKDAKDYDLGKSRHQAFMQLINLDAYKEGIEIG